MKNIVLVAQNNVSVVAVVNKGQNQYKAVQANNNKIALLTNLTTVLNGIPTNDDLSAETRQIIIGSKSPIIGLVTGTWRKYIKEGKTAEDETIPAEELALWKNVAKLYAERCFNVQFTSDQFIGKNDRATKDLIKASWEIVKAEVRKANNMAPAQAPQVAQAPTVDPIAQIGLQIAEASMQGDMEKVMALTTALNALKSAQAPVVNNDPLAGAEEMDFDAE